MRTTRPTDPLYKKIRMVGLRSAITLIGRYRPVGWLVVSLDLQCVSRTDHRQVNHFIQRVRGPRNTRLPSSLRIGKFNLAGHTASEGSRSATRRRSDRAAAYQGPTLVPNSAQLELFCPPYNPTQLMNVSWSCST